VRAAAEKGNTWKNPYPAGSRSGMPHPITQVDLSPPFESSMVEDIGDGFRRPAPGEYDVLKKAVLGYEGNIPQWKHHHGVGESFTKRRDACLKKAFVVPSPTMRDRESADVQRLNYVERNRDKGPWLCEGPEEMKQILSKGKAKDPDRDHGPQAGAGSLYSYDELGIEMGGVSPHVLYFEKRVPGFHV